MRKLSLLLVAILFLFATNSFSQLSGTKNIPGDYATLLDAVTALNTQGVGAGGVTFVLGANQSLAASLQIGSATLNSGAAATSQANPVVIDGAGFGIIANFAGTRTGGLTASIANDASLVINGTDFITIKNCVFTQQASNTTTTTAIENAIAFQNRNAVTPFDGCQNDSVRNCTFNMGEVATGGAAIQISAQVYGGTAALAWGTYAAAPGDMHRDISITNNSFTGYNFVNYYGATTANGRKLFVNNNTMTDIGGAAVSAYGFYGRYVDSCTYNSNTASMSAAQSTTNYIAFLGTNAGGYQEANGNNITIQSAVTTSQTSGIYYTSIGADRKMNNNIINFGTFSALTTGTIYGLFGSNSGGNNNITEEMNGNTCTGQTLPGSTSTTSAIHILNNGAATGTNRQVHMKNNIITNNTRSGGGTVYALNVGTADITDVSGNKVDNFTWTNNSTSSAANFYGIYGNGSPIIQRIYNDTISNITISGSSSSTTGTLQGIRSSTTASGTGEIYNNKVNNLSYGSGINTGAVTGIYISLASQNLYKNKIYTLSAEQAAGAVTGINIVSGTTNNVYNNIVSDLATPNATGTNAIIGVNISGGTNANLSYNTVFPSSAGGLTSAGATFGGSGIYVSSSVASTLRNNIVNINGTAATGYFAAIKRSTGTAGVNPANLTLSNNIYNSTYIYGETATEATATNLYYFSGGSFGTADPNFNTSCGLFKTWKGDAGSFTEDNVSGSDGVFQPTGSSYAESGGTTATTPAITDDFSGTVRNAVSPDMGAIEFAGTLNDASGPTINYINIPAQNCTNQPVLSADITDASNVNTSAGTKPRLYFKKSTEANAYVGNTNADNGWKYVEASNAVTPFTLTIDYSLLTTPAAAGDTIQYFVVAEDLAGTPNVGNNTAGYNTGFCPTTVALTGAAFPVSGFKNYVINISPSITVSASPLTVCANNNDTLSVQLTLAGNVVTGTGTSSSSTYTPYYGSTTSARRIQFIITAAELKALGLRSGNITAVSFDLATVPAAFSIADFTLKMGHTSLNVLTTSFSADATTTVLPSGSYSPVVGINTHTLTTPFAWDGVSNVIVEACHGIAGTASLTTAKYTSSLPSGIICYTTNALGCTQPTGTTNTIRPNITLAGQKDQNASFTSFAWNDGTGPVGANNDTIIVQPPFPSGNTMTYSVVATDPNGCTFNGNVVITKNTSTPTGTAAVDKPSICYGDSVLLTSTAAAGCPPYNYSWSNGVIVVSTAASFRAYPTANTTYTLTITDNSSQTYSPAGVPVSVNAPVPLSTTPASRCGTGTVTLGATASGTDSLAWYAAASGGTNIGTGISFVTPIINTSTNFYVGAYQPQPNSTVIQGAGATTSATYSNPFYSAWSNNHTQHLITAAELKASGLIAGNINSVALNVTSAGTLPMIDLAVKIGATSTTSLTAFDNNAGFQTVYTNPSLLPTTGVNVLTFTAPFNWDGTSNIILEFCHGNGASTATMSRTVLADATTYISSIKAQISAATPAATICADVTSQILTYSLRPQFIFNGVGKCEGPRTSVTATVTPPPALTTIADATICNNEVKMLNITSTVGDFSGYSWAPVTGLYTDAGGNTAYTGQILPTGTVYVKSATGSTTQYIVTGTNSITPFCSNTDTVIITVMPAATVGGTPSSICVSGTSLLALTPSTGYGTGTIQWQQSATGLGGSYSDISLATTNTYTTPTINSTTWYGVQFKDGTGATCLLNPTLQLVVNNPQITGTPSGSRCGPGNVTLTGTGSAGTTLNWYSALTGGTPIGTGNSFYTPVLSSNTNYFVSAGSGFSNGLMGRSEALAGTSGTAPSTWGLCFNATSDITLDSVTVILNTTAGGTLVIELRDSLSGSSGPGTFVRNSASIPIPTGTVGQRVVIPIGFNIPAGNGYRLLAISGPSLIRSSASGGYPYLASNGTAVITSGFITNSGSTTYYFFYDWKIKSGCESSPRTLVTATINPVSGILAATTGGAQVCKTENVYTGNSYFDGTCDLIARLVPSGASPVAGQVNTCVKIDATVQTYNGDPYVQRHYDIEPATNAATATGTVTLYFKDQEFVDFNAARGVYPALPTVAGGGSSDPNVANLRVTQFHGTGTAPGNYTGASENIDPADASIIWNATDNRWEVTFTVTGFSGFYIHTGILPIPVKIEYFRGSKQGNNNLLDWKVTPVNTSNGTMELQHSLDGRNFNKIYSVTADATRMLQSFSYSDSRALNGINYYRLKVTDDNGVVNYSAVVALVNSGKSFELVSITPNPVTEGSFKMNITTAKAGKMEVVITDVSGRIIRREMISLSAGFTAKEINVSQLAAGSYLIQGSTSEGKTKTLPFVKQ